MHVHLLTDSDVCVHVLLSWLLLVAVVVVVVLMDSDACVSVFRLVSCVVAVAVRVAKMTMLHVRM